MNPWIHEFISFATGCQIGIGYGLSKAGSGVIINQLEVRYSKPGTIGGLMINCEVRLEPIQDYDDPEWSEILISGQCNCIGYLNDDKATKNLFIDEKLNIKMVQYQKTFYFELIKYKEIKNLHHIFFFFFNLF